MCPCSAEPLWKATAALRLGAPGCRTALRLVDSTHAILHEFDAAAFSRAPSAAAHAATAVAVVVCCVPGRAQGAVLSQKVLCMPVHHRPRCVRALHSTHVAE